jgi:bifunctional non-homologous end joining protein LigD
MGLETYRRKRDAARTPEPVPAWDVPEEPADHRGDDQQGRGDTFVIQEHHATALHWDVRLERDGVLVSWAVPKGLPLDPDRHHLAKQTEDHPLAYATFEGDIPKGEYGGGQVIVWDAGTYTLNHWGDRTVDVVFHGERAQGRYVFFRARDDWLVRRMDPPPDGWQPLPEGLSPMLAVTKPTAPGGDRWAAEFKWDGVRALVSVEGGRPRAMSRNHLDVTAGYPELRELAASMSSTQAVLDGELVAFDAEGRPSFERLQQRMHVRKANDVKRLTRDVPVTFLIFDVLHLDGRDLTSTSYEDRRRLLDGLDLNGPSWQTTPWFPGAVDAVLQASKAQGLEGIVAKRLDSSYLVGKRSDCWIKVKNVRRQEVVIGGWKPGEGGRSGSIGSLLIGVYDGDGLHYAGHVGTGFTQRTLADLKSDLEPLARATSPFADTVPREHARNAHWVEPQLVCEVEFAEWTKDNRLRHPSYKGLRIDREPTDVIREPV